MSVGPIGKSFEMFDHVGDKTLMIEHHPFWLSGGARGVNDGRQIVRPNLTIRMSSKACGLFAVTLCAVGFKSGQGDGRAYLNRGLAPASVASRFNSAALLFTSSAASSSKKINFTGNDRFSIACASVLEHFAPGDEDRAGSRVS